MVDIPVAAQTEAVAPGVIDQARLTLEDGFKQFAALVSNIREPLPNQTGDGSEIVTKPDSAEVISRVESSLKDFVHRGVGGSITDIATLLEVQNKALTGEMVDDKNYLMEKVIKVAASLPDESALGKKITDNFITQLWGDLQHPPQSYLGAQYQYRSADGSFNSLMHPDLGKAGTPYARTVSPHTMRSGAQPDPEVIFDSIMIRKHDDKHPNGISSVLFYLASIIIHDLFCTKPRDYNISETSSYLDLSPLYGNNLEEQMRMRDADPKKARGHIKRDCFSEKRLIMFPPGVAVLLVMFNRFHNYVVDQLAEINEGDRFHFPGEDGPDDKWKKYDEDLFQTARLITCGLYVNLILIDYVRTILNLNKTDSNWQLNPRVPIKDGPPMGTGNQVSAEFNLVYRWHSTISKRDQEWTEAQFKRIFPSEDFRTIDWHDFVVGAGKFQAQIPVDPQQRPFHGLKRNADGSLPDDDLVQIMVDSIDDCANAFGANRVPAVMRAVEVLGIQQARQWNVATLNEFRKYFGLTPHCTFSDINKDPEVAEQLRRLYDHPDLVELYPGLVVEDAKIASVPGAGLTPGYSISRGVLSDAVALTRGDRFYTIDYHPRKLTNWGFSEVKSDLDIDHGCLFYKLFLRAFPNHFTVDSVYAHFPLTITSEMRKTLKTLNKEKLYTYEKPKRLANNAMIFSHAAAEKVLADRTTFKVALGQAMESLIGSEMKSLMLTGDGSANTQSRQKLSRAVFTDEWSTLVRTYYERKTAAMLKEKSYTLAGRSQVDIIRDIGNLFPVHFAADLFNLPLKTTLQPHQVFTEAELYLILAGLNISVFFDLNPRASFPLRKKTHKATQCLGTIMDLCVKELKAGGVISWVANKLSASFHGKPEEQAILLRNHGRQMIQQLLKTEMNTHELVWGHILGTAGAMVPNQGQLFAQMIEYFTTEGQEHLPAIRTLALRPDNDNAAFEQLVRYVLEAVRLNGETGVSREVSVDNVTLEDSLNGQPRTLKLKKGDSLMVNLRAAFHDPAVFPDPDKLKLDRPLESYITLGYGPDKQLTQSTTWIALAGMLRVVGRLQNLRPAKGPQGKLAKLVDSFGSELDEKLPSSARYHKYLPENWDAYWPFPTSLKVNWDDGTSSLPPTQPASNPLPATSWVANPTENGVTNGTAHAAMNDSAIGMSVHQDKPAAKAAPPVAAPPIVPPQASGSGWTSNTQAPPATK